MRRHTLAGSLGGALALTLLATLSLPGAAQAGDRGESRSEAAGKAALAHAQEVLSGRSSDDVSMALRDLFRTADGLSGADLTRARAMLARPTDSPDQPFDPVHYEPGVPVKTSCATDVCVHWVESGPSAADPAYAQQALYLVEGIHQQYVAAGYRAPLQDQGQGGDSETDIYLADVGSIGAYGYCTTDIGSDGQPSWVDGWTVAPYCVFDNDFSPKQYGRTHTPTENLDVTAAHEYFHAVQYAYDANDDVWAYETTATWVEDEMFDAINDNLQYLPYGQMGDPAASSYLPSEGTLVPLDYIFADYPYPYGNWTFWRYLTEKYPDDQAGLPTLVRTFWEGLDTTDGEDAYSLQSLDQTLAGLGTSTAQEYAGFSTANRTPAQSYSEGDSYPTPALAFGPIAFNTKVTSSTQTLSLDHLTSGTGAYVPSGVSSELNVQVAMGSDATSASAIVLVIGRRGAPTRVNIALDESGSGEVTVPFSKSGVQRVEVTLVNGSSAMKDCGTDTYYPPQYSCAGFGEQDDRSATVTASVLG
jgi:hypothetical protein